MTEHGEASTSALRTRVRLPPSPHIHPHDRVHADIFFEQGHHEKKWDRQSCTFMVEKDL